MELYPSSDRGFLHHHPRRRCAGEGIRQEKILQGCTAGDSVLSVYRMRAWRHLSYHGILRRRRAYLHGRFPWLPADSDLRCEEGFPGSQGCMDLRRHGRMGRQVLDVDSGSCICKKQRDVCCYGMASLCSHWHISGAVTCCRLQDQTNLKR